MRRRPITSTTRRIAPSIDTRAETFKTIVASVCLLLTLPPSSSSSPPSPSTSIPVIDVRDLRAPSPSSSSRRPPDLHDLLLGSGGVLRIATDVDLAATRARALGGMCRCGTLSDDDDGGGGAHYVTSHPEDLRRIALPDGTARRTLATATIGFPSGEEDGGGGGGEHEWSGEGGALELPSWLDDACGTGMRDDLEDLRDAVSSVVDLFVSRLDSEEVAGVGGGGAVVAIGAFWRGRITWSTFTCMRRGGGGRSSSTDVGDIHDRVGSALTLDYHTDAGFFLAFVPAMDCRTLTPDVKSFFLHGIDGPIAFGDDEVIIMMGAGAQHWLPPPSSNHPRGNERRFVAASHALRLGHGTRRAWYGKMHLLPESSSMNGTVHGRGFRLEDYNDKHLMASPVDGCGTRMKEEAGVILPFATTGGNDERISAKQRRRKSRRRLQHVNSPANCNNVTNFFCWHQCLDIPDADRAERYVRDGYSLYCLDPAFLPPSSTSSGDGIVPVSNATTPCRNGYVHNSNCVGSWQRTDEDVPGYKLPYETREESVEGQLTATHSDGDYCYGGTSMYMDGFQWRGSSCVIYLFQSWTLSTPFKFAMAAFGSVVLGVSLEYVLRARRRVYALSPGARRLVLSTAFYGLQLTMGYFIMLVIMTYSGPLFLCTVGGMMVGHAIFNAQDSLAKRWLEKVDGGARRDGTEDVPETLSGSANAGGRAHTELASYQNGDSLDIILQGGKCNPTPEVDLEVSVSSDNSATESTRLRRDIADGATPCCQYIVD